MICGTSEFAVKGGREGTERAAAKPPCSGSAAGAAPPPGAGQGRWQTPAQGRALLPPRLGKGWTPLNGDPGTSRRPSQALPAPRQAPTPAPTCSPGSGSPARPPATAAMILMPPPACPPAGDTDDADAASCPPRVPPSLSRPAYPPSFPPEAEPKPNDAGQTPNNKKSAGEVLRLCGLEKRRLRTGGLGALCSFLRRGGGEGGVELFSLVPRTGRVGMVQSCSLSLHWTLGTVSLPRGTAFLSAVCI